MDNFKKYLLQHKKQLNAKEPGEEVWNLIKVRVQSSKNGRIFPLFKKLVAACIIILAGTGTYLLITQQPASSSLADVSKLEQKKDDTIAQFNRPPYENEKNGKSVTPKKDLRQPGSGNIYRKNKKEKESLVFSKEVLEQYTEGLTADIENQKTIISSTPVAGISQDYFTDLINKYKMLEKKEKKLKEKMADREITSEVFDEIIQNLKARADILIRLRNEIDKVNALKKKKSMDNIYVKLI